ncbi:hypothetical protein BR93DRAFT_926777 [Coniochaeta sp. PMI_546]|nr:hypothetical protein BR93DRAFT_926777 [Coniochaeta sp. PMI_546]
MPRPATTSARRYDSNSNSAPPPPPPSYKSHDTTVSPTDPTINSQPSTNLNPNHNDTTVHASLLQPRVAVALGLSAKWHPLLFVCRLMSILPALWWGVPVALRLLAQLVVLVGSSSAARAYADKTQSIPWLRGYGRIDAAPDISHDTLGGSIDFETRLMITEMALGIVWVSLSFILPYTQTHTPLFHFQTHTTISKPNF